MISEICSKLMIRHQSVSRQFLQIWLSCFCLVFLISKVLLLRKTETAVFKKQLSGKKIIDCTGPSGNICSSLLAINVQLRGRPRLATVIQKESIAVISVNYYYYYLLLFLALNYFRKTLHLRYLTGFSIRLWSGVFVFTNKKQVLLFY